MTIISSTPDVQALTTAVESRDFATLTSWYEPDAVLTTVDRDHPPTNPLVLKGREAIGAHFEDVCTRDMTHEVRDAVITADALAYTQHCRYPDGTRVVCATVARLSTRGITRQTVVQAWDE